MKLSLLLVVALAVLRGNCQVFTFEPNEPPLILDDTDILNSAHESQLKNSDDMEDLLGRSRWCRKRDGMCRTKETLPSCPKGYSESKYGRPYCMGRRRRCCYPGSSTDAPTTSTPGCPKGFFQVEGSSQCYKLYNDARRSWEAAKGMCEKEGLILAEPRNALNLRKYLVETYGKESWVYSYLGARGTGSYFKWENSGKQISNSSSLWYSGHPASYLTNNYCVLMLAATSFLERYPNQPYYAHNCGSTYYTLCEYVNEASQTY